MSSELQMKTLIDEFLSLTQCDMTQAQLHGLLSGFLSAGGMHNDNANKQLEVELAVNHGLERKSLEALKQYFMSALASEQLDFELLLGGDNFVEQLAGFVQWCELFLTGFALVSQASQPNKEVQSFLQDVVAFSQLDVDNVLEEDEKDFYDLTEYLRLGIISLFLDSKKSVVSQQNGQFEKNTSTSSILNKKYFH